MEQFITTIKTSGKGFWSRVKKEVDIIGFDVRVFSDEDDGDEWGELRVYFDTNSWNTQTDGLIYTDEPFAAALESKLTAIGLVGADISYSEQGMQGRDYISFDVGEAFIESWRKL